jgi:hypothetical protein
MSKNPQVIAATFRFLVTAAFGLAVYSTVLLFAQTAEAQEAAAPVAEKRTPLTPAELEDLVGPIALYPDDLVSIVLPASTYPIQIVQAARFLEQHKANADLKPNEDWDDSVVALLNYPEVIELMNTDLDWTWELGEAAIYQQTELLDAIQNFRERAYAAGNLKTDEHQVVTRDAETIVIKPADPTVIYVPYYESRHVVVHQSYPVYHYYPYGYPVYYYPYPYRPSFGFGFFWGVTIAFAIDWHAHHVRVHHHRHRSHPYHGRFFRYPWYRGHSVSISHGGKFWRPGYKSGSRQRHTARVLRANRVLGAAPVSRGKFQRRNDQRLRRAGLRSKRRAIESGTAAQGRKRGTSSRRQVPRIRTQRGESLGVGRKTTRALTGTKITGRKASPASVQGRQPGLERKRQPRRSGGVRSNRGSRSQSRGGTVSRQMNRPISTSPRHVSVRQGISRPAARGKRAFKGYRARGTQSRGSGWGRSFRSSARSGVRSRQRSMFGARASRGRR